MTRTQRERGRDAGRDGEEKWGRKVGSRRKATGTIRSLLMLRICSLSVLGSCIRHCSCLFSCMLVRMMRKVKERSRIRVAHRFARY